MCERALIPCETNIIPNVPPEAWKVTGKVKVQSIHSLTKESTRLTDPRFYGFYFNNYWFLSFFLSSPVKSYKICMKCNLWKGTLCPKDPEVISRPLTSLSRKGILGKVKIAHARGIQRRTGVSDSSTGFRKVSSCICNFLSFLFIAAWRNLGTQEIRLAFGYYSCIFGCLLWAAGSSLKRRC